MIANSCPVQFKLTNPNCDSFLHLLEDDPTHDVTLVSSDGSLMTCHALVLAASSPYLAEVLQEAYRQDDNVLIVAQNIQGQALNNLVEFLYRGNIRASRQDLKDVKDLLKEFQVIFMEDKNDLMEDMDELSEKIKEEDDHRMSEDDDGIKEESDVGQNGFIGDDDDDYVPGKVNRSKISQKKRGRPKKEVVLKRKKALADKKLKREELKRSCDYCGLKSKSLKDTMKHVQKTHPQQFSDFAEKYIQTPCQYCDNKFLDKPSLYLHKKESHSETLPTGQRQLYNINDGLPYSTPRQCPQCPKVLRDTEKFKEHIEKHITGHNQPFACEHFDKRFSRMYRLKAHTKKHEISKTPLLCNLCGSSFQTEFEYEEHDKNHIREAKLERPKVKVEPKPIDPNFSAVCSICGKEFSKMASFKYHIKNAHAEEDEMIKCPHCPRTLTNVGAFNFHIKLHLPPTLECKHCDKKFSTNSYLKRHIRSQHLADSSKDFVCNQCGKGFNMKDAYLGHLNMHAGLKPYKCRYCETCFQNSSNRIAHEKSRHPDVYERRTNVALLGVPLKNR